MFSTPVESSGVSSQSESTVNLGKMWGADCQTVGVDLMQLPHLSTYLFFPRQGSNLPCTAQLLTPPELGDEAPPELAVTLLQKKRSSSG